MKCFYFPLVLVACAPTILFAGEASLTHIKGRPCCADSILVKPKPGRDLAAFVGERGERVHKRFERFGNLQVLKLRQGADVPAILKQYRDSGLIQYAEPDWIVQAAVTPDDTEFGSQWGMAKIQAPQAWDLRTDAPNIIIAVIDTGINYTHEDLAPNMWTNSNETPGNGIDDDGNGYIDDVYGINALNDAPRPGDPLDDQGHGSHVAGIAGGAGNNSKGVAGVCWNVKLMGCKFLTTGGGSVSDAVECIQYALSKGAHVLNNSWGGGEDSQALRDAIVAARTQGVFFVAAAGNDGLNTDHELAVPAAYPFSNVVSVANTDQNDLLSSTSTFGLKTVDLGAPGTTIFAPWIFGNSVYATNSGTSMACPHVSGALALMKAHFPSENYLQILNRLYKSVDYVPALEGRVRTGGRLNLYKSLTSTNTRPYNDNFSSAQHIVAPYFGIEGINADATLESGEPAHAGVTSSATLWYAWTPTRSGTVAFDTANSEFDTVLAVYTGTALGALSQVAANDDNATLTPAHLSKVIFSATVGTTYRIAIAGKNGATGGAVLNMTPPPPPNDNFANATALFGKSATTEGWTVGGTLESGEPNKAGDPGGHSIWYTWTAPASGSVTITTVGSDFDTLLAVYTGSTLAEMSTTLVTENDDESAAPHIRTSKVTFNATSGVLYRVCLDGFNGISGNVRLEIQSNSLRLSDVIRDFPLPPAQVPRYGRAEFKATLSNVVATSFYDPDPASNGLDLKATFVGPTSMQTVDGYYDGSDWRIRFAPREVGVWNYSVSATDSSGTATWSGGSFLCAESGDPGFVRIDGRYLRFDNGQVFFPVGHNIGWRTDVEQPDFNSMRARGENFLSFWMAQPWATGGSPRAALENLTAGVGTYDQAPCQFLDGLVQRAETAGVYLLPTLWSHGQLRDANHSWSGGPEDGNNHWWYNNPYKNLSAAYDFFVTSTSTQWRKQQNFLRYVLARWGYSKSVCGWVAVAEIDGTNGYGGFTFGGNPPGNHRNKSATLAWCGEIRDWFRANDTYRTSGNKCPLTVSKTNGLQLHTEVLLDMSSYDSYSQMTHDTNISSAIASETLAMRAVAVPAFHAEFGGEINPSPPTATQPTHLHNGIWAGISAGACMAPQLWTDGLLESEPSQHFPLLNSTYNNYGPLMRDHLEILARFVGSLDFLGDASLVSAALASPPPFTRGWYTKKSDRAFGWVQKTSGTLGGESLSMTGIDNGNYRVEWFDVWDDGLAPISVSIVSVPSGTLVLTVPVPNPARADLAFRFRPASEFNNTLGRTVWDDLDSDGVQDANEWGLAGVSVRLRNAAQQVIATTVTNTNGHYVFAGLAAGSYDLEFVLPAGFVFSPKDSGADDADSDADPATGRTASIVVSDGNNQHAWAAGMHLNRAPQIDSQPAANPNPTMLQP